MDTIIAIIHFLTHVLTGASSWEILDEHPSSLFPTTRDYKRARKAINRELTDAGLSTLGENPTVRSWANSLVLLGINVDLDVDALTRVRDEMVDERLDAKFPLVVEEVAHAPVLNAQAERVARGEVKRDARGRIMSAEVAAIFDEFASA